MGDSAGNVLTWSTRKVRDICLLKGINCPPEWNLRKKHLRNISRKIIIIICKSFGGIDNFSSLISFIIVFMAVIALQTRKSPKLQLVPANRHQWEKTLYTKNYVASFFLKRHSSNVSCHVSSGCSFCSHWECSTVPYHHLRVLLWPHHTCCRAQRGGLPTQSQ